MPTDILWKNILSEIEKEITSSFFKAFLTKTKLINYENGVLNVTCASEQARFQIENKYLGIIKSVADKLTQSNTKIVMTVEEAAKKAVTEAPLLDQIAKEKAHDPVFTLNSNLSTSYTFDSFVVGPNNRLASAVAHAIADNPGTVYNPFFIYSGVGLGKTHLMQAIGNEILKNKKGGRVVYTTGESFTNEMVEAIQNSKRQYSSVSKFRDKYRNVDALLIDDVQFIAGRETTQEEFFHTFNALYLNHKQIILTSDRPPKDIARLEERLSSRFLSGMTADMQAPDLDMRSAILRQKRDQLKLPITNEVTDFIAERVLSNVRELEGALLKVSAVGQASGSAVTIDQAAEILGQVAREQRKNYTSTDIIKAVASYYNVKLVDLKGPRRQAEVVVPRQIAMYLVRSLTQMPVITLGEIFGGRDHSTVIHATDKIALAVKTDTKMNQDIINIKQGLL
ncbi:MAG: chromosomal replication initiator protein DnaA [candidate division WWE3 bacterium]|nr:chromosomal replication initiator protein DnaA [candidate division WWE3 bacterium]